jgi:hypothetical protein
MLNDYQELIFEERKMKTLTLRASREIATKEACVLSLHNLVMGQNA